MKIILLQDVSKVGRKNEVKEVSDGYARNFLFAKNLAKPASAENIKSLESQKIKEENKKSEEYQRYNNLVGKLENISLHFKVKMGEKGRAFGSVTPLKITEALEKQGVGVEKDWILLEDSIKTTGEQKVKIKLPQGLMGEVKILVEAE